MNAICTGCELDTAGNHQPDCPNGFTAEERTGWIGWECPVCGRGNAPWKGSCDCRPTPDLSNTANTEFIDLANDTSASPTVLDHFDWLDWYESRHGEESLPDDGTPS